MSKNIDIMSDYLSSKEFVVVLLDEKEGWTVQQEWRKVYAKELNVKLGTWIVNNADWHVFSYGYKKCKKGGKAEELFATINDVDFYLFFFSKNVASTFYCKRDNLISRSEIEEMIALSTEPIDIYISAKDYNWTFVCTHENDMGPFYSQKDY